MSGKYGSLQNKSSIDETYTDLYAPLFGKYSIVGRSIVIHRPTGARWVCASIGYPGPVIVANTDFNGDVEGIVIISSVVVSFIGILLHCCGGFKHTLKPELKGNSFLIMTNKPNNL